MSEPGLELYRKLYLIRRAEEAILRYYPEDDMKTPMHMSMGQEAAPAAVCQALGEDAEILCSYRSHAPFLARTGDLDLFFAEMYGKVTGTADGKSGSMHLACPDKGHLCSTAIVGSGLPVAVGAAFANKRLGRSTITCVFFGDGAMDEGAFWESLNAASLFKVPLLFILEDNGLAVHTAKNSRHGYGRIEDVVKAFDCGFYQGSGDDAEALLATVGKAAQDIRAHGRPAFLRVECYRYLEHVGINEDFDAGYRPRSDYDSWLARDAVKLQREKLLARGQGERAQAIETEIDQAVEAAIERAKAASLPDPSRLTHGVFSCAE
ncbi:MAG: thiamine pyrophosphate-dependent dehydrogenase E1 component subunit alpha [Rhodospirillales bacterium]|jgi:pyruvate dehydrogenase E1 component alpha subunit